MFVKLQLQTLFSTSALGADKEQLPESDQSQESGLLRRGALKRQELKQAAAVRGRTEEQNKGFI